MDEQEDETKDCPKCGDELAAKLIGDETYDICVGKCGYYEA